MDVCVHGAGCVLTSCPILSGYALDPDHENMVTENDLLVDVSDDVNRHLRDVIRGQSWGSIWDDKVYIKSGMCHPCDHTSVNSFPMFIGVPYVLS